MDFSSIIYICNHKTPLKSFKYRVSKDLLGYSRDQVHCLISLHEGEWLGDYGELLYVLLNSLRVLWMLIIGFQMFSKTISLTKKVTKGESKG